MDYMKMPKDKKKEAFNQTSSVFKADIQTNAQQQEVYADRQSFMQPPQYMPKKVKTETKKDYELLLKELELLRNADKRKEQADEFKRQEDKKAALRKQDDLLRQEINNEEAFRKMATQEKAQQDKEEADRKAQEERARKAREEETEGEE